MKKNKICSRCNKNKPFTKFHKRKSRKIGICSFCKDCAKKRLSKYIKNNPEKYKTSCQQSSRKHTQKYAKILSQYKNFPCKDCGIKYERWIMQFDHLPQYEKKMKLSQAKSYPIKDVLNEIAKCEVVCANCHKIRTKSRKKNNRNTSGSIVRYIQDIKHNKKCQDCHKVFPYFILEFDHVPERGPKEFNFAHIRGKSKEEIDKEMLKCDILCSNCHHERTYKRIHNNA